MDMQLKTSQLKQCGGDGENIYPITKIDNVYMSDGRTLLQYIQSVMGNGGSNVNVEPYYTDGVVVATITVNGEPKHIVVPYAGYNTIINENGEAVTVIKYEGIPKLNPSDFYFNENGEVTIINKGGDTPSVEDTDTKYHIQLVEGVTKKIGDLVGTDNSISEIKVFPVTLRQSMDELGNIYIQLSHADDLHTVKIPAQHIIDLVTPILPQIPDADSYSIQQFTNTNNGGFYFKKNDVTIATVTFPRIPEYTLFKNGNNLELRKDGTTISSISLPQGQIGGTDKYYLSAQTVQTSIEDISVPDSEIPEYTYTNGKVSLNLRNDDSTNTSIVDLPLADGMTPGLALYDAEELQMNGIYPFSDADAVPVKIENGRPYISDMWRSDIDGLGSYVNNTYIDLIIRTEGVVNDINGKLSTLIQLGNTEVLQDIFGNSYKQHLLDYGALVNSRPVFFKDDFKRASDVTNYDYSYNSGTAIYEFSNFKIAGNSIHILSLGCGAHRGWFDITYTENGTSKSLSVVYALSVNDNSSLNEKCYRILIASDKSINYTVNIGSFTLELNHIIFNIPNASNVVIKNAGIYGASMGNVPNNISGNQVMSVNNVNSPRGNFENSGLHDGYRNDVLNYYTISYETIILPIPKGTIVNEPKYGWNASGSWGDAYIGNVDVYDNLKQYTNDINNFTYIDTRLRAIENALASIVLQK